MRALKHWCNGYNSYNNERERVTDIKLSQSPQTFKAGETLLWKKKANNIEECLKIILQFQSFLYIESFAELQKLIV